MNLNKRNHVPLVLNSSSRIPPRSRRSGGFFINSRLFNYPVLKARVLLFIFCLFLTSRSYGDSIFVCKTSGDHWSSTLKLTETGKLTLDGEHMPHRISCQMTLLEYQFLPRAVVPSMWLSLKPKSCQPRNSPLLSDLLKTMTLSVNFITDPNTRVGTFQWVKYLQPQECKIETFEYESLQRNAKKWEKGLF